MSRRKSELIETFQAVDDDGNSYDVLVHQELIESSGMGRPNKWIEGMIETTLDDGRVLNCVDDNTFTIVSNGKTIRRVH